MLTGSVPWPADFATRYRRDGYWQDRTLGALPRQWATEYGDATALVDGDRRWTYRELDSWSDRLASGLRRLGLTAGDRVVVHLPNIAEFLPLCFALFRLGALPVLALPAHRENEIAYLCEFSEATAYVIADQHLGFDYRQLADEVVRRVPSVRHVLVAGDAGGFTPLADLAAEPEPLTEPHSEEVALFLLSGGTTGAPKLIPRTHADYAYNLRASAEVCRLDRASRYLVTLPIAHNFPLGCPGALGTLHTGGTVVLTPDPSPEQAFPIIERERITVTALVPALALLWMEAVDWFDADLSSLRLLQVGGARFEPEAAARVRDTLGCELQQVFGMAEGLLNYTRIGDPDEVTHHTQGRPLSPADEILVVDEEDRPVPPGAVGQLLTRGPYTLRGYYRAEEHNKTAFTHDGFYRTGDLVRVTEGGNLVVAGRVKDVINRGGDKVPAEELEALLAAHPMVHRVAVVPAPDPVLGERTCAVVVPNGEPPALSALTEFLQRQGVAAYKLPDRLTVVDELPLTAVGKIDKKELAIQVSRLGAS